MGPFQPPPGINKACLILALEHWPCLQTSSFVSTALASVNKPAVSFAHLPEHTRRHGNTSTVLLTDTCSPFFLLLFGALMTSFLATADSSGMSLEQRAIIPARLRVSGGPGLFSVRLCGSAICHCAEICDVLFFLGRLEIGSGNTNTQQHIRSYQISSLVSPSPVTS